MIKPKQWKVYNNGKYLGEADLKFEFQFNLSLLKDMFLPQKPILGSVCWYKFSRN